MSILFQDRTRPIIEQLRYFHDHRIVIITLLTTLTLYITILPVTQKSFNRFNTESQEIESIWTIIPFVFLCLIALPSMKVLYIIEESKEPTNSIKVTGRQWYWTYETSPNTEESSFMEHSTKHRLMKTRFLATLPPMTSRRILVTSSDVIHSWAIPSMGLKVDAVPGRLNQMTCTPKIVGVYFGQCSEICGANHSFIPIVLAVKIPTK